MSGEQGTREHHARSREQSPPGDDDLDPARWKVLWVCLVTGFMTLLDVTIVNVALPSVQEGLGASSSQLQWVLTGYAVAFGLMLVPAGRLGDSYGRKKVFLVGLVVFTIGSVGCGLAQSPEMLVLTRVLQGLGAGTLNPQITAIINTEFRGPERGKAFGYFGATVGLSTAVGPLLGGVIIDVVPLAESWRYVFWVNLPVAVVAFVLGLRLISNRSSAGRQRLDLGGTLLRGVTVVLVLLAVQERDLIGWPLVVAGLALAAAGAWAFIAWERRYAARGGLPLARPGLFGTPGFTPGILIATLYFAGFTAVFFTLTLSLQTGLGYSALHAGLTQTPSAAAAAVSSPLSSRAVAVQGRTLTVRGLVMVAVGLGLVVAVVELLGSSVSTNAIGLLLIAPLLIAGAGSGQVIAPNTNISLVNVDRRDSGSASGVFQTFQRLGAGFGIAIVGSVFFAVSSSETSGDGLAAGLACTIALVLAALVVAVVDVRRTRVQDREDARRAGGEPGSEQAAAAHHAGRRDGPGL